LEVAVVTFPVKIRHTIVDSWKRLGEALFHFVDWYIGDALDALFLGETIANLVRRKIQRLFFAPEVEVV
jgi:hypothetical protein